MYEYDFNHTLCILQRYICLLAYLSLPTYLVPQGVPTSRGQTSRKRRQIFQRKIWGGKDFRRNKSMN